MITTKEIKKLVKNEFFTVIFVKKNGELREMNCRLGVKKHLKGGEKTYDAEALNYLTVFDLGKKNYRTINLNTLKEIRTKGEIIKIGEN